MPSGDGNVLTIHTNDGTERFRIDSSGNVKVGSAATISPDGDVFFTGVCTATTLAGAASGLTGALPAIDGSALTGMASTDNVRTGILDVAGISTFRNTMNVGAAVTISESGIEASGIGITCANINGTQVGGRRNVIINGAMQVSQRHTSFSNVANNAITLDRFGLIHPYSNHFNVSQSTDSPDGFSKSYKLDVNTVDSSIGTGQYVAIRQRIEGQNLQQLAFGTSAAKPISLSFYVRSNKTGTFAINIQQTDNSSKQVSAPYTISSANTWERKTFTFAGDTSGVINDDNGTGLTVIWWLSAGSTYNSGTSRSTFTTHADADAAVGCNVNILDSTDNNFYLTGVQLEIGSQCTDFEHRSIGEEKSLCERYYQTGFAKLYNANQPIMVMSQNFMPEMRAAPTITGEQFGSETNAIWSSIEVTTSRACAFYKNGEICQQWNCDAEL